MINMGFYKSFFSGTMPQLINDLNNDFLKVAVIFGKRRA